MNDFSSDHLEEETPDFPIKPPPFEGKSRAVSFDATVFWFQQSWSFFVAQPGVFIAISAIVLGFFFSLSFIPHIGLLLIVFSLPIIFAGYLFLAHRISRGKSLEIVHFFEVFKRDFLKKLCLLGGFFALFVFLARPILSMLGLASFDQFFTLEAGALVIAASIVLMWLILLLLLILITPLFMLIWFIPVLIMFHNASLKDAFLSSFYAALKNVLPFLACGAMSFILSLLALATAGVGFLVVFPLLAGAAYAAYRDIFLV